MQVLNAISTSPNTAASGEDCSPVRQLHTVYVRMNRWAKSGVLERVFEFCNGADTENKD